MPPSVLIMHFQHTSPHSTSKDIIHAHIWPSSSTSLHLLFLFLPQLSIFCFFHYFTRHQSSCHLSPPSPSFLCHPLFLSFIFPLYLFPPPTSHPLHPSPPFTSSTHLSPTNWPLLHSACTPPCFFLLRSNPIDLSVLPFFPSSVISGSPFPPFFSSSL